MSTPPVVPAVSPIDAVRDAIDHTRRHLFPFRFERWFALGFVAFLDQCGRGGLSLPNPGGWNNRSGGAGGEPDLPGMTAWISSHVGLIVILAAAGLAVVVGLTALILWVNSRGIFMYIDDVATGRTDIERTWREHADRAGSLFAWRFTISLISLVLIVIIVLGGLALVVAAAQAHSFGVGTVIVGILLVLLVGLIALAAALVSVALRDFVAPLQLKAGLPCGAAVQLFLILLRGNPGAFALYVLLKIAFVIVAASVSLLACCLCCCIMLPVVVQTALQPLFYFERAWSLQLLRQLGYDLMSSPAPEAA